MIYNRQVTVTAGSVIEVFDKIGISPGRYDVAIQVPGTQPVYLVEDGTGANPGLRIPPGTSLAPYRLVSNKDPVYIKNYDSTDTASVYLSLTAVP